MLASILWVLNLQYCLPPRMELDQLRRTGQTDVITPEQEERGYNHYAERDG